MAIENYMRDSVMPQDVPFVDALTEEAPIVEMLPMQPTNKGMIQVIEKLKSTDAAQLVDLDGALPTVTSDSTLEDVTLSVLGGRMVVGEDAAKKYGSKEAWFTKKLKPILKHTGEDLENSLIYNTWRPFANTNSKEIDAGGTTADSQYSILAIKFVEDETFGLFNPDGFGNGKVFDIEPLNGGTLSDYLLGNGVTTVGFGQRIKTYFGIQTANVRNIGSIVNVELTADATTDTGFKALPTEAQMDDLLESVRAMGGNTYLMMHPKVANALSVYKGGRLEMTVSDDNMKRRLKAWEDIPIITSRNFKNGTEAVVS